VSGGFVIEPLAAHDRDAFSSGSPALDSYFRERVGQDAKRLMASCFVAVEKRTGRVAGYYTLSAYGVPADELPNDIIRKLPRYPAVPAALIGRLAVDAAYQRRGVAGAMITDAAVRVIRGDLKAFAILVDAKDEVAAEFYQRRGFLRLARRPLTLFIPVASFKGYV